MRIFCADLDPQSQRHPIVAVDVTSDDNGTKFNVVFAEEWRGPYSRALDVIPAIRSSAPRQRSTLIMLRDHGRVTMREQRARLGTVRVFRLDSDEETTTPEVMTVPHSELSPSLRLAMKNGLTFASDVESRVGKWRTLVPSGLALGSIGELIAVVCFSQLRSPRPRIYVHSAERRTEQPAFNSSGKLIR